MQAFEWYTCWTQALRPIVIIIGRGLSAWHDKGCDGESLAKTKIPSQGTTPSYMTCKPTGLPPLYSAATSCCERPTPEAPSRHLSQYPRATPVHHTRLHPSSVSHLHAQLPRSEARFTRAAAAIGPSGPVCQRWLCWPSCTQNVHSAPIWAVVSGDDHDKSYPTSLTRACTWQFGIVYDGLPILDFRLSDSLPVSRRHPEVVRRPTRLWDGCEWTNRAWRDELQ